MNRILAVLVGLFVSSACVDPIVPERQITAHFPPDPIKGRDYFVPDTVVMNIPFDVVILPMLDCGSDAIPAQVTVSGTTADVTARAVIPRHEKGQVFTCEGRILNKSVGTVSFSRQGPASIRLHGRTTAGRDTTISVAVTVRNR